MIDTIALALGHALLGLAMVRLVQRADMDSDPLIRALKDKTAGNRLAASSAGRNAGRRAQEPQQAPDERDAADDRLGR